MAEIWDVYDENGNMTGKTMKRGEPKAGEYMLCAHIYLYTPDRRFLIQKRSMTKESHPGEWDITCGAILSGEESLEGAKRETLEEVGIDISDAKIHFVERVKKKKSFADIYFVEKEFAIEDCILQEDEVDEVRLVDSDELLDLQMYERHCDSRYMTVLKKAIKELA